MRLWHKDLIPHLPRQQLLGQHRECCALRGKGWGKKQSTVDYVFEHPPAMLYLYHRLVMNEMVERGYSPAGEWIYANYRGKSLGMDKEWIDLETWERMDDMTGYPEHNNEYLIECLENLREKGIDLYNRFPGIQKGGEENG